MEISIDPSGQKLQALSAIRDDKVIDFSFEGNFISKKDFRISQFGFSSYKHIYYNENWFYLRLLQFPTAFSAEYFTILKYNSDKEEPLKFYNPANTGHEEDYIKHLTGNSVGNDEHLWEKYPQLVFYDGIGSVLFEHNDTIYRFNSAMDSLQMRYVMDCGDRPSFNLSHQYSQTDRSFFDYIYVNKLIESKDYIYLTVSQNTNRYLLQFDKVTGSTQGKVERRNIVSSRSNSNAYIQEDNPVGFTNDLCGGLSFYPDYINEKQWIARYEISDLKNGIDIEKLKKQDVLMPEKRDQLVKILENLDDEDNPILVIATLK
jgi:hypothetical protein